MIKFRLNYFVAAIILFVTELCIARFFHGGFIRNNIGDFLVVILLFCLVRSLLNLSVLSTAIAVLLFSYSVEILQYLNIVEKLGLQNSKWARILIGTSFEWADIIAYTLGIALVLFIEKAAHKSIHADTAKS